MNNVFRAHPLTIFIKLRSWWFVFTAPLVRRTIQLVLSREIQKILPSELVAFVLAFVAAVAGWISTKVVVCGKSLRIERGFVFKSCASIDFSRLLGMSARKGLFYILLKCVRCNFYTNLEKDKNLEINLKPKDFDLLCDIVYGKVYIQPIKRQKKKRRFFVFPVTLLVTLIFIAYIKILFNDGVGLEYVIFLAAILIYGFMSWCEYKKGEIRLGNTVSLYGRYMFTVTKLCCRKADVGIIKVIQTPFDLKQDTCKIKIVLLGESSTKVKIRNVCHKKAICHIKNYLKQK